MSRYGLGLTMLVLAALAVTISGCGRTEFAFHPVEGTVTKGGRPLRNIDVIFLADSEAGTVGPRASGTTDEAGHYRLRTDRGDDGAVAGKHVILVLDPVVARRRMERSFRGPQPKDAARPSSQNVKHLPAPRKTPADAPRIPSSYGRINETPLRAEVRPGEQVIDLEVK